MVTHELNRTLGRQVLLFEFEAKQQLPSQSGLHNETL